MHTFAPAVAQPDDGRNRKSAASERFGDSVEVQSALAALVGRTFLQKGGGGVFRTGSRLMQRRTLFGDVLHDRAAGGIDSIGAPAEIGIAVGLRRRDGKR